MSTLFKVLNKDGLPAHGGSGVYPLPRGRKAGDWTVPVVPRACTQGYHLTSAPHKWWVAGARLFIAEWKGAVDFSPPDKVACESVRLIQEVTPEWGLLPIYPALRALLFASWRFNNPDQEPPEWADLSGANLSGADLSGANLSRANLYGADLSWANLSRANLYGADLSWANLSRADLSRANLYWANLYGANLYGANLSRANLSRADLSGANLSRANLSGADLSGANLSRANLSGADLYGANLSRANLYGADLSRANDCTLPPGWRVEASGLVVRA